MATSTPSESPQDPAAAGPPPTVGDVELTNLQRLRASGALTEDEYARAVDAITKAQAEGDPAVTAPSAIQPDAAGPDAAGPGAAGPGAVGPDAAGLTAAAPDPADPDPAASPEPVSEFQPISPFQPAGSAEQASAQQQGSEPVTPPVQPAADAPTAPPAAATAPPAGTTAPSATATAQGSEFVRTAEVAELMKIAKNWWVFLVTGLLWVIVALILVQFSTRSIATVGYIAGALLVVAGIEYLYVGYVANKHKWLWFVFGTLFVVGGVWAFLNPGKTAATLALSLGLLFVLVGVLWIIEAATERSEYSLWWLGLISGIVMVGLGVWAANQTTAAKMATLLWVAFMWALITGITDIFRAFYVRRFGKMVNSVRA